MPVTLATKLLATASALTPVIAVAAIVVKAASYHEPDPGPGNMPDFIPAGLVALIGGALILLWALPQLVLLPSIWRGRARSLFRGGALWLAQAAVPAVLAFRDIPHGRGRWVMGAYAAISAIAGIGLITSSEMRTRDIGD